MPTVEQTMMKVQRILTGPMDLTVQLEGNAMAVRFQDASTQVRITVFDWGTNEEGEPQTVIRVASPILWRVEPSLELFEWVAREGADYLFGHVVVMDDEDEPGTLFLLMTHTLLGDYVDEGELSAALWGVLGTADELDDQLQDRFGGQRWDDL